MTTTAVRRDRSARLRTGPVAVIAACATLAVLSLPLPAALTFDAHAWLVWGREVTRLSLDTAGGPSWKPLPVLITTLLAPLGTTLAAAGWLVVARTAGLLAVAGTYRLAARVAGPVAGGAAVVVLVLSPDGDPRFLRLVGEGHVDVATAAFAVWGVLAHVEGRHRIALGMVFGAALVRPEAWPFLVTYAVWLWRRDPDARGLIAACVGMVPVLWFGGDWWGSGSPVQGASAAQVGSGSSVAARLGGAITVLAGVVAPGAWAAAAFTWAAARERWIQAAGVGTAGWGLLVVTMAATLGYAALSRFFLPVAAVVAALAGIGGVRAWRRLVGDGRRLLAAVLVAAAALTFVPRAVALPSLLTGVAERAPVEDDLDQVLASVEADRLRGCANVAVETTGLLRMAVAWKLDRPVGSVPTHLRGDPPRGLMLVRTGSARDDAISRQPHTEPLVRSEHWSALAVNC